jgi:hypothetical protein
VEAQEVAEQEVAELDDEELDSSLEKELNQPVYVARGGEGT